MVGWPRIPRPGVVFTHAYRKDTAHLAEWLSIPNSVFDGFKPLEIIERGESDRIWRMIYDLEAGEAF
jgi:hypothetical protein